MILIVSLTFRYPHFKVKIFRILIGVTLIGFFSIRFIPHIETQEKTLDFSCERSFSHAFNPKNNIVLTLKGRVEPCMASKLRHHYANANRTSCKFVCQTSFLNRDRVTKSAFSGGLVRYEEDKQLSLVFPDQMRNMCRKLRVSGSCYANCTSTILKRVLNRQNDASLVYSHFNFWLLVVVWTVSGVTAGAVTTFQDAICQQILESSKSKESYGQQRLWASFGYGLAAIVGGKLVDLYSSGDLLFDYRIAYDLLFVAWLADIVVVGGLHVSKQTQGLL